MKVGEEGWEVSRRGWGWNESRWLNFFFLFFFSRFNEAFLNLSSACRSIEGGGREDRVDPASTMDS